MAQADRAKEESSGQLLRERLSRGLCKVGI